MMHETRSRQRFCESKILGRNLLAIFISFCLATASPAADEPSVAEFFRVPDGFEVTRFAGAELADNIFSMTIDRHGRVVVSGPGYVKILRDDDSDGQADRATLFTDWPKSGSQGMCFDGDDLICVGDGGLWRVVDRDGDGVADGKRRRLLKLANPEHGGHGIVKGPDGWLYVIAGNDAGVTDTYVTSEQSPIDDPHCGVIMRVSPDGEKCEVLAHGFRNPYRLTFNADGRIFTVDADGERAYHLPWYSPMRAYDVAIGRHHGWLQQGWSGNWARPAYFPDNVPRLAEMGRGSPTGLVCYRHRQFPERYRGGLFSACWTLGTIYYLPLKPSGSSYETSSEVFLQTRGSVGFAPVDLAVGPEGDLFVATGGRGTEGGVFRVRYRDAIKPVVATDALVRVLSADQPLTAWSRARWMPAAMLLGEAAFQQAWQDDRNRAAQRMRAIEILVELFEGIAPGDVEWCMADLPPSVMHRAVWALSYNERDAEQAWRVIAAATRGTTDPSADPCVARVAWEALSHAPRDLDSRGPGSDASTINRGTDWQAGLSREEPRVRRAAIRAAQQRRVLPFQSHTAGLTDDAHRARLEFAWRWVISQEPNTSRDGSDASAKIASRLPAIQELDDANLLLEAIRLIQLALGDVEPRDGGPDRPGGYWSPRAVEVDGEIRREVAARLSSLFPSGYTDVDRELTRTVALLEVNDRDMVQRIAGRWSDDSSPVEDVHDLLVVSRVLDEPNPFIPEDIADCFCRLHGKLAVRGWSSSRTWPIHVGNAFKVLTEKDPQIAAAIPRSKYFGRAEHSLFVSRMSGDPQQAAARQLLASLTEQSDDEGAVWTSEAIQALACLPDEEFLPVAREHWTDPALRDTIAKLLAARNVGEDRERLLEALASLDETVVVAVAGALRMQPAADTAEQLAAVVRGLANWCGPTSDVRYGQRARKAIDQLLRTWFPGADVASYEPSDPATVGELSASWRAWGVDRWPELAGLLKDTEADDWPSWRERLARIDFSHGDVAAGRKLYETLACHRCHGERGRLGPDLAPAVRRFNREDLFASIVAPNRSVSETYRTVMIVTNDGRTLHGLPVYQSPEGTLLQTSPTTTLRLLAEDIAHVQPSSRSLMPEGLLRDLSDQAVADLDAYLQTLR